MEQVDLDKYSSILEALVRSTAKDSEGNRFSEPFVLDKHKIQNFISLMERDILDKLKPELKPQKEESTQNQTGMTDDELEELFGKKAKKSIDESEELKETLGAYPEVLQWLLEMQRGRGPFSGMRL